ncbi:hypothetical protein ACVWZ4_003577 [Bradyrhizobium sp. USDA 4472]
MIIDIEQVDAWPHELLARLSANYDALYGWEADEDRPTGAAYDRAIGDVNSALQPHSLVGWHCTRLTDEEVAIIRATGLSLPNAKKLDVRIDRVVSSGQLDPDVAARLKAKNQADEPYRAGRLSFCFFAPSKAGEAGINRFFRCWGGEALYNSHERDPVNSKALGAIGTPCIVEAEVPISHLGGNPGLAFNIVRRYLIHRGHQTNEPYDHADRIVQPLSAAYVREIHMFPEERFLELSGCADWRKPL